MANRCILPVIRQPYIHVPVVQAPAEVDTLVNTEVDTLVNTRVETEVNTEVDTLVNTEVDTRVETEVDTLVNTEVSEEPEQAVAVELDATPATLDEPATESASTESVAVTESKRGRKPKNVQPEPFAL